MILVAATNLLGFACILFWQFTGYKVKGGEHIHDLNGCSTNSITLRIVVRNGEEWNVNCFCE